MVLARALSIVALSLLSGACADPPSPEWVELARGFEPRPLGEVVRAWQPEGQGADGRSWTEEEHGVRVALELAPDDWTRGDEDGAWSAALPQDGAYPYLPHLFVRLESGADRLLWRPEATALEPGQFTVQGGRVHARLPPEVALPERVVYSERIENGRASAEGWQVRIGGLYARGIPVWSGMREEVACRIPPDSALSFVARFAGELAAEPVRLRVSVDGDVLFEHEESATSAVSRAAGPAHVVTSGNVRAGLAAKLELPADGASAAKIAFEVEGARGLALFLTPVIHPLEVGRSDARPWGSSAPDVVLFLADTFRADNLALYGGDPALAPNLNRFAEQSLRFPRARSVAAWTLPAVASLLTGACPGQHGASDQALGLSPALDTIAEELARAGYRTGAITDGSFFSSEFGLDQGFEWFLEKKLDEWELTRTIDDALLFLARDDGRPVFLVVHTYRTHGPYRVGPDEDASRWDELAEEARAALAAGTGATRREIMVRYQDELRALYEAGVRDLDHEFGRLVSELERRGLLARGALVFTSDHGEALGENADIFHGGNLWEAKLRIPLLVHAGGLAPREVSWTATQVDVAPTIAALAGIARVEGPGTSLLALDRERSTFAFRLDQRVKNQIAVFEETKKLLATSADTLLAGACDAAYDLAADPMEATNLATAGASWTAELARRTAESVRSSLIARTERLELELAPETRAELDALGYADHEDR